MENPEIVTVTDGEWMKVGTAIYGGRFFALDSSKRIVMTHRLTGEAAPDEDTDLREGVPVTNSPDPLEYFLSDPSDLYAYGLDGDAPMLVHI
jgi:hypothetical protein